MVLEHLIDKKLVRNHMSFVFLLSALYVFVAYAVGEFFFPGQSVAIVLLVTILLTPSLHHLIVIAEAIQREGGKGFWRKHKTIINCYLGAFLGLLLGFFIMGLVNPSALDYQVSQLEQDHLRPEIITAFLDQPFTPTLSTALSVFTHNLSYLLIGFVLSIFYGAGAIFLVVYTTSLYAAFVMELMARWANAMTLAGIALIHLMPESAGFILTAIAGATLSKGIMHENLKSQAFRNVMQSCVKLLVLGIALIFVAAFIETYITAPLFHTLI